MTKIQITTTISAPIETVFNLSRNIDIHLLTTQQTNEKAIAGRTSGLIELNETVTWRGKHFGFYQNHKSIIPKMDFPIYFVDEMLEGSFKSFRHEHSFKFEDGKTIMSDDIFYEAPFGIFGKLFDTIILEKYMTSFIKKRNEIIKNLAENPQ
ncbi:SRPBCC family protein [Flavobacterium sp. PLA-1-15]|uniref:SRPBCC family protein n=1 Tax=Flavobacterium sp. PLA-1-15 TaxID=3380533 RepID=UPI003B7CF366